MADLISRAAAIDAIISETRYPDRETIDKVCGESYSEDNGWVGGLRDAINAVEEVNAVDAVPVVYGRWEEEESFDGDSIYQCSVCGETWILIEGTPLENNMNYCPHCGAKMDGERREARG